MLRLLSLLTHVGPCGPCGLKTFKTEADPDLISCERSARVVHCADIDRSVLQYDHAEICASSLVIFAMHQVFISAQGAAAKPAPPDFRSLRATLQHGSTPDPSNVSRRHCCFLGLSITGVTLSSAPALADEEQRSLVADALSAPLEFLKSRQRANNGEKLLAPIRATRRRLQVGVGSSVVADDRAFRVC